jgi:hypothetical protein
MEVVLRDGVKSDETFLSLLSSQRELLNQLNVEAAVMRDHLASVSGRVSLSCNKSDASNRGSQVVLDSKKQPKNRRSSLELISKRLSIDFGIPVMSTHGEGNPSEDYYGYDKSMVSNSKREIPNLDDLGESYHILKKKRRLSSFGFVSATFFEDNLKSSRHSFLVFSTHKEDEKVIEVIVNGDSDFDSEDEFAEDVVEGTANATHEEEQGEPTQHATIPILQMDPEKAREHMESFTRAMEKSQKTQQDIHDWDRQMGLKRSHSKTMRLSTRSRKKLRATFKKDFGFMLLDSN